MKKNFRIATFIYLILLGITLGAGVFAGAVVAPVIFNTQDIFNPSLLNHFQEGQIMTAIFIKLGYLIDICVVYIALYEGYKYKMFERDKITSMATFVAMFSGLMFVHYYMPDIINMQLAGEQMTNSKIFVNTHKASEIDFKLFALSLLVLIIQNMKKACK
jgi:hypothetical protein